MCKDISPTNMPLPTSAPSCCRVDPPFACSRPPVPHRWPPGAPRQKQFQVARDAVQHPVGARRARAASRRAVARARHGSQNRRGGEEKTNARPLKMARTPGVIWMLFFPPQEQEALGLREEGTGTNRTSVSWVAQDDWVFANGKVQYLIRPVRYLLSTASQRLRD